MLIENCTLKMLGRIYFLSCPVNLTISVKETKRLRPKTASDFDLSSHSHQLRQTEG